MLLLRFRTTRLSGFEKEDDMVTALAQGSHSKQQKDNKKTTSTPKSMQKQDGTRDYPTERPEYFVIEALHRPFIHKTHIEPSEEPLQETFREPLKGGLRLPGTVISATARAGNLAVAEEWLKTMASFSYPVDKILGHSVLS